MTDDPEWDAKVEKLSLEPEAIILRKRLDQALNDYWEFFSRHGVMPGIRVSVGENQTPKRKMH